MNAHKVIEHSGFQLKFRTENTGMIYHFHPEQKDRAPWKVCTVRAGKVRDMRCRECHAAPPAGLIALLVSQKSQIQI